MNDDPPELATKSTPYWWEAAPLSALPQAAPPASVDVLVVGAGYAGLAAALVLARAGRSVLVLDRQHPGEGASTRNGGITSGNIRPPLAELERKFGRERAQGIVAEGKAAREDLRRFIETEGIDCDYALVGRFSGAMTAAEYEAGAREADRLARTLDIESYAVPPAEQHKYIGTDFYRGGNVRMDIGGLHPGKFHAGLLKAALAAGALVRDRSAVLGIARRDGAFDVRSDAGTIRAGQVLVCTNGYTNGFDPWLRRRVVPVRSRIVATEPLAPEVMDTLMPSRMMMSDGRELSYYYRPSPDGSRILFGGRDGTISGDPSWPTAHLRTELARIFPGLREVRLSHSWFGYVAMHRDMIPRIFTRDGVLYATGFCGSGVVWARWLGSKAAAQLLGDREAGRTAFDFRPPRSIPFFNGTPWFMPAVYAALEFKDRRLMKGRGPA
ncbi:oxidoreductase [Bordetella genomosp. 10]|uniref:Oxidoreductase n=1 Tax=Bordetella genomosp. 10 TaxID=1416804 RepID=A0A261SJI7_9BORD|nr:FAD-binding oxidoreductase [Bordetella genomosp. 10]OZI37102.1 oxidoreductase [Bordetella genomosp. 10]